MKTKTNSGPAKAVPGEAAARVRREIYEKTLEGQNKLADALIAKLEKIKALSAELPSQDDLDELSKTAAAISGSLNEAAQTYNADDFPTVDDLEDLDKKSGAIHGYMESITETANADDFPVADQFDDLDKKLSGIVGSLNEIIENQEDVAV